MRMLQQAVLGLAAMTLLSLPSAGAVAPQDEGSQTIQVTMTTSLGDLVFELDAGKAPITVANFLRYAQEGQYDGTIFHRVLADFMAQGGGFDTELRLKKTRDQIPNEAHNGLKNTYGTIAMARLPGAHTATCQFFINCKENGFLDHKAKTEREYGYCVFGKLVGGLDVFETLRTVPVELNPSVGREKAYPVEQIVIGKVVAKDAKLATRLIAEGEERMQAVLEEQRAAAAAPIQAGIEFVASQGHDVSKGQFLPSGLWVLDLAEGEGASPLSTQTVRVHYTGWLPNGSKFDSSRDRGEPAEFPLNGVISGWTVGVGGMKPGGRRMLVIPYQMAYGEAGRQPTIPARATLVFDIELLAIVR